MIDNHNAVHMIGHNDMLIQVDPGMVFWNRFPARVRNGTQH